MGLTSSKGLKNLDESIIDGVNQSSTQIRNAMDVSVENNSVTILTLPPKGSANDLEVKLWNQVVLTKDMQQKARDANIPYHTEWFMISRINTNDDGVPVSYNLSGSMGGGWIDLDWNQPGVIEYVISDYT